MYFASQTYFIRRLLLILSVTTFLAACATVPEPAVNEVSNSSNDAVIEANEDQLNDVTQESLEDLPLQELDSELLEQLLVMNLASIDRNWGQAAQSAFSAAQNSEDFRLARLTTMMFLQDRNYPMAAQGAQLWNELRPDDETSQDMQILALVGAEKVEEALAAIRLQAESKETDEHIRQIAGLLVRQTNASPAIAVIKQLTVDHSDSAQVFTSSAFVAEHFREFELATQWVEQAIVLRSDWDLAAQMKARLLLTQGKLEERATFIEQFVQANPKSEGMRISYAAELARKEDYASAFEIMQGVLEDAPDNVDALEYAAALADQLEDRTTATKLYRQALKQEPNNDQIRWSLARLAVLDEKLATAERLFNDISSEDLFIRAQIQVANIRKDTQGMRVAVNTLRALRPRTQQEFIDIALTRHYLLTEAFEYEEALSSLNETMVYLPGDSQLLYARALVAAELDEIELAEQDLRIVIAREPENANALNALGYTLADKTDRLDEAKDLVEAALVLRPNDAHILDSMGWILYRLKDFTGAIEFLEKALLANDNPEIIAHLGEVLWESGDKNAAIETWQKGYKKDNMHPVLSETIERYGVDLTPQPEA